MMNRLILLSTMFGIVLSACSCLALENEKVEEDRLLISQIGEEGKFVKYEVQSMKMHLFLLSSENYNGHYVIKEYQTRSLVPGIEGVKGKLKLELWSIGKKGIDELFWTVNEDADSWGFEDGHIFFLDKGCCNALDKKYIYDIDTAKKIDQVELERIPVKKQLESIAYPK